MMIDASHRLRHREGTMRGSDERQQALFSYVSLEDRIAKDHPLRVIREFVDRVLVELSPRFDAIYASTGRASIPPEQLLRALVLQVLYTIRSERLLMEQLDYNLLFRWFVGLNVDDAVWVPTVFTKNRDRLLRGEIAEAFHRAVVEEARRRGWLSDEHFTVDGTLLEAWASHKSFQPRGGGPGSSGGGRNGEVDFRGQRRSNATHRSTTDPEARLARKGPGREAKLAYQGNVLVDNRHGLPVATGLELATGRSEREGGLKMLEQLPARRRRRTVGGDKGYDTRDFVQGVRELNFTPHVAQNTSNRRSAIDRRTTRQRGYARSQRRRKVVEQSFGWVKTIGLLHKLRHRGRERVAWVFSFTTAVYAVVRMRTLHLAEASA
jgi:transposase